MMPSSSSSGLTNLDVDWKVQDMMEVDLPANVYEFLNEHFEDVQINMDTREIMVRLYL